jgi:hypothetical protein
VSTHPAAVRDLDHVVMTDGRIYRVVGNLDHPAKFVGYNVYSPDPAGGRLFRSTPYRKNFTEDDELPDDALDTYGMLPKARICEHLDPRTAAPRRPGIHRHRQRDPLATELRGTSGFGYDAIFIPDTDPSQRTYAQMTSEEKNKISHRRRAVEAMRIGLGLR